MEPKITTPDAVWTLEHKPVTATEVCAIRDRLLKDADAQVGEPGKVHMTYTMRIRSAIDLDHLARLMDADAGVQRLYFTVDLKEKAKAPNRAKGGKARAAKLSPARRKAIAKKGAAARWKKPENK